ncbi:hypothetical protein C8R44DRAFT_733878 [Mycena epipterygia]|nr:hypothetical protein C8R44DRAFT_733878 [Mycena epipterygia]
MCISLRKKEYHASGQTGVAVWISCNERRLEDLKSGFSGHKVEYLVASEVGNTHRGTRLYPRVQDCNRHQTVAVVLGANLCVQGGARFVNAENGSYLASTGRTLDFHAAADVRLGYRARDCAKRGYSKHRYLLKSQKDTQIAGGSIPLPEQPGEASEHGADAGVPPSIHREFGGAARGDAHAQGMRTRNSQQIVWETNWGVVTQMSDRTPNKMKTVEIEVCVEVGGDDLKSL